MKLEDHNAHININECITKDTPHFKWFEVFRSDTAKSKGIDNTIISDENIKNVINTAIMMETVRSLFNKDPNIPHSIIISSWYRCDELNTAVGGTKTSHHRLGMAVDFHVINNKTGKKLPIKNVIITIINSGMLFTQLIDEYNNWVHISFQKNNYKKQVLTFKYDTHGKTIKTQLLL